MATSSAVPPPPNNTRFSPNITGVTIDPQVAFPQQYSEIVQLKKNIAAISQQVMEAEANAANAATAVKALGAHNIGNTSFRGKNAPSVYAAFNAAKNDYVARGNFSINGFPFRVNNSKSFNAVLAQMKQMRGTVGQTLRNARSASNSAKQLQTRLKTLDDQLKVKTAKLRKNVANATAKASKAQRRGLRQVTGPSYTVQPGTGSVSALNTALMPPQVPKKGFFSRMFGRGRSTRRANRR
jgi:phage shock protein A